MQSSRAKIRAYIIFNRHGHRAPGRNVMLGGGLQEEKELWQSCAVSNDNDDNENMSGTIKQHAANGIARDLITHPFGCITKRGRDHLETVGKKVSNFFPSIKTVHSDNLMVYSTNYQRTQVSAQMMLRGLFSGSDVNASKAHVEVRDMTECAMSFYDGFPAVAVKFFKRAQSTEEFIEREARQDIMRTKEELAKCLPGLLIARAGSDSKGRPHKAEFDWFGAFDYFVCREAHSLPLAEGTESFSKTVRRHLFDRYGDYYKDPVHLAHTAVPLLLDLEKTLPTSKSSTGTGTGAALTVTLFSGHDINILALLFALKADIMTPPKADELKYWPDYGSTMIFEVEKDEDKKDIADDDEVNINVYLDLVPLAINMDTTTYLSSPSSQPSYTFSFTPKELRNRIENLSTNLWDLK